MFHHRPNLYYPTGIIRHRLEPEIYSHHPAKHSLHSPSFLFPKRIAGALFLVTTSDDYPELRAMVMRVPLLLPVVRAKIHSYFEVGIRFPGFVGYLLKLLRGCRWFRSYWG